VHVGGGRSATVAARRFVDPAVTSCVVVRWLHSLGTHTEECLRGSAGWAWPDKHR
jgi:hypothetical protein